MEEKANKTKVIVYSIIKKGGTILLLHRTEDVDVWEFPGGKMKIGETPQKTAIRELMEETGIKINDINLFSVSSYEYKDGNNIIKTVPIFYIKKINRNPKIKLSEHKEFKWLTLNEIKSMKNMALSVESIIKDIESVL